MFDDRLGQPGPLPEKREPKPPERKLTIKSTAIRVAKALAKILGVSVLREVLREDVGDIFSGVSGLFDDLEVEKLDDAPTEEK